MTKQEQIEEMAKDLENTSLGLGIHLCGKIAEKLYDLGYRKEKETAKEILQYFMKKWGNVALSDTELVTDVARFYGVEVEE